MADATRYEIELRHNDGRAYLIAYAARQSGAGLRDVVTEPKRWDAITAITGCRSFEAVDGKRGTTGYQRDGWTIRFSGRTARDARSTGELPFILDEALAGPAR